MPEILQSNVRNVIFGVGSKYVAPVNLYDCTIGDNSFVGPFSEIQKGVVIGANTRIQSHSFICELVTIGDNCFIGHGVMFTNDLFSKGGPSSSSTEWKATQIGNNVSIGSNSTILPVTICNQVVIGAGSVVTKDITKPGIYLGNPARFHRDF